MEQTKGVDCFPERISTVCLLTPKKKDSVGVQFYASVPEVAL